MALRNKPAEISFYDPKDNHEDSVIGEGATSCVKELKDFTEKSAQSFMKESEILFRVHHPCIIDIMGMNNGDEKHHPSLILSLEKTSLENFTFNELNEF
ncbi:hypothetical protein M9Y10_024228 [Tritrichomonas musculus]|uniref:Protein kinase domain-containing protein n=1 Tax=Tritrichomonas musculus TaxID=1915356 RepID=A0ABR2HDC8_9EUKA